MSAARRSAHLLPGENSLGRRILRDLPYWSALGGGLLLFEAFRSVGLLAGRPFFGLSVLFFTLALLVVWLRPGARYFFTGLIIVTAPRAASLLLGTPSHHLLFPLFLGMATGLLGRRLLLASTNERSASTTAAWIALVFVAFCLARAWIDYYSPFILTGYPLQDLEVAPGVSANHAFFLCTLLLLHISGPLLFAICDARYRGGESPTISVSSGLIQGLALGLAFNLVVMILQFADVDRLWIATARSRETGRLPGLFTDSGAASVLLPCCFAGLYFLLRERFSRPAWRVAPGVALFGGAVLCGPFLGRGYWVALGGVLLSVLVVELRDIRGKGGAIRKSATGKPPRIGRMVALGGLLLALIAVLLIGLLSSAPRNRPWGALGSRLPKSAASLARGRPFLALYNLEKARALQIKTGYRIFREAPLVGTGANSFMVEAPRFQWVPMARLLKLMPIDNPANIISGLLSDFGLLGLLLVCAVLARYGATLPRRWSDPGFGPAALWVALLPLALLPSLLFGYHIVFAEFSDLLLLPALLPAPQSTPLRRWPIALAIGLIAVYAFVWARSLDGNTPPAFWRSDHGAQPQLRPDARDAEGGLVFYNRRNFATWPGAAQVTFRLRADRRPGFFCYARSERIAVAVPSVEPGTHAGSPETYKVTLPEACLRAGNLEIDVGRGAKFTIPAADFDEHDLGRPVRAGS